MKEIWNDEKRSSTSKVCFKCKKDKSLLEYYRHREMRDGHLNKCKECAKNDVVTHRNDNIERIRKQDRERAKSPHRREKNIENCKKMRKKFPLKYKAHNMVNNALRDGKIKKSENCETCNKKGRQIEGHHDDYSKPLDVIWLCSACHKQLHRDLKKDREA